MTVEITWNVYSGTEFESASAVDHGEGANGDILTEQRIQISHNGANQITGCKFYLVEYSETYTGGASASDDLEEILNWGEQTTANDFGGIQINMDAVNDYAGDWPTYDTPYGNTFSIFRSGDNARGADFESGIVLDTNMSTSMSSDGVIPASASVWPEFKVRIQVPTNENTTGIRQFDQKLRFTYTS